MADDVATMKTLLAQTVLVANQAAASAAAAAESAAMVAGLAPLASPVFTGNPTAPTPTIGDDSQSLATTQFLARLLGAVGGIATLGSDGKLTADQLPPIQVTSVSVVSSQSAMLALTGINVGAIALRSDLSNAEFILTALPASTLGNWTEIGTSPVLSVAGLTGAIDAAALLSAISGAPLASPNLTGTPTAPTAAGGTNTTQIATTAFVAASFAPKVSPTLTGTPTSPTATIDTNTGQIATTAFVLGQLSQSSDGTPAMDGVAARGTSTHGARADHIHPVDTSRAPLASPALTGVPTAPTATGGTNTTQIATCAFVAATLSTYAPLNSPAFTGTPTATTRPNNDNSTKLATTAYADTAASNAASGLAPIATNSIMPIGWSGDMYCYTQAANNALINGSQISTWTWDGINCTPISGNAGLQGGATTWKNISGGLINATIGKFVRTA